ncbi:hypothetical protein KAX17_01185, partial [Candidatus Bipolaricaulota bacterium]|nr:hypothetical protein [Candidatus Bipolaricaulota bacterium]
VGEAMRQTAFLLGNITGYAGFVIPPRLEETRLDQIVLIRMDPRMVLLVIVSDIGVVEHKLIPLEKDLSAEEINRMTQLINDTLCGVSLDAVRELTLEDGPEGWYEPPVRQALSVLRHILERRTRQCLYFEGILNLADSLQEVAPARAMERFASLIHAVQDERAFTEAIRTIRGDREGVMAAVSSCPLPGLEEYSVVTSDYRPHSGVLGVIAPLWMDYGKALSTTSYIANRLEALLVGSCKAGLRGQDGG